MAAFPSVLLVSDSVVIVTFAGSRVLYSSGFMALVWSESEAILAICRALWRFYLKK